MEIKYLKSKTFIKLLHFHSKEMITCPKLCTIGSLWALFYLHLLTFSLKGKWWMYDFRLFR